MGGISTYRHATAASHVAAVLRRMIVDGELPDGVTLPRQEDLLAQFGVSHPSLREALRMLEAEGLITVQRGNRGGSVVHSPDPTCAAFTIGLVLQRQRTSLRDTLAALTTVEMQCAILCAQAEDRNERIVPVLEDLNQRTRSVIDDPYAYAHMSLAFHDAIAELSGIFTLGVVAGALSALWRAHMFGGSGTEVLRQIEPEVREAGQRSHEVTCAAIADGEVERVQKVFSSHLAAGGEYWMGVVGDCPVDVANHGIEGLRRAFVVRDRTDPFVAGSLMRLG
jgi:GntR family transcriptional regulator, transcriptional repressor for pyruvate dehydrogenase complex